MASKQGMEVQSADLTSRLKVLFDTSDGRQTIIQNRKYVCVCLLLSPTVCPPAVCPGPVVNGPTRYMRKVPNQEHPRIYLYNHVTACDCQLHQADDAAGGPPPNGEADDAAGDGRPSGSPAAEAAAPPLAQQEHECPTAKRTMRQATAGAAWRPRAGGPAAA